MADESWDDIVAEAENSGFGEPAPLGTYEVKIIGAEAVELGQDKKPAIKMKFKITRDEHAGKPATTFGHTVWKSPAWVIVNNCAAVGITGEVLKQHRPTMSQIAAVMEGKVVSITTQAGIDWKTKEPKLDRNNSPVIEVKGTMQKSKFTPAPVVTAFPPVSSTNGSVAAAAAGPAPF